MEAEACPDKEYVDCHSHTPDPRLGNVVGEEGHGVGVLQRLPAQLRKGMHRKSGIIWATRTEKKALHICTTVHTKGAI